MPVVTVEPVEAKTQLRRFAEIPYLLHHRDPRWSPGVRAFEQWRLDARRHPYFDRGDAAYLLARRGGRPVGRIAAHVADVRSREPEAGRFGFFDADDDAEVVEALLDAARAWLTEQGATTMTGPYSWTAEESVGVVVSGHDHRAVTGLDWQPDHYARRLAAAGGVVEERHRWHHLPTATAARSAPERAESAVVPPHAGAYGDPAIVLDGVAAVPDVSALLAGASLRRAWRAARRVRERDFDTAVCVRCEGDPDVLVPALLRACRAAGYERLIAPWGPPGRRPEQERVTYRFRW